MQTVKISALVFGVALVTAACGDSKSSLLPTAPSAVSADSAQATIAGEEYGTTANGPKPPNGNGNGNGNGNRPPNAGPPANPGPGNQTPGIPSPLPRGLAQVEIQGLISEKGSDSITVRSQLVSVTADSVIRFRGEPSSLSELNVGDQVHVRAGRTELSPDALLKAIEIMVQRRAEEGATEEEDSVATVTPLVSVSAFDASAAESGADPGVFRLTRVADLTMLASPLTVSYTLTGTATNGVDYQTVPLSATFDAGQTSVDVTVTPLFDMLIEGDESINLTLTDVASYEFGSPATAAANIADAVGPFVTVATTDGDANEAGNFGVFTLTRTGSTSASLSVTVMFSGTASQGADYDVFTTSYQLVSTTVTFPAGSASVSLLLFPKSDQVADPSETVIITVVDGDSYDPGAAASATLTITGT